MAPAVSTRSDTGSKPPRLRWRTRIKASDSASSTISTLMALPITRHSVGAVDSRLVTMTTGISDQDSRILRNVSIPSISGMVKSRRTRSTFRSGPDTTAPRNCFRPYADGDRAVRAACHQPANCLGTVDDQKIHFESVFLRFDRARSPTPDGRSAPRAPEAPAGPEKEGSRAASIALSPKMTTLVVIGEMDAHFHTQHESSRMQRIRTGITYSDGAMRYRRRALVSG